jgi:flavin-dependent dehydrogenase
MAKQSIVVLEKGSYPRDKYCAGAVGGRGDKLLAALAARPDVPSVPIVGLSYRGVSGERAERTSEIGRVIRRIEFDRALAGFASARGIQILDGARVDRVELRANGATIGFSNGEVDARVVVGADGVGSVVRRAMGLGGGRLRAQALELDTEPVTGDRARDLLHFDAADQNLTGYFWDFPTLVSGRELVTRGIYHLKINDDDTNIHALLRARLAAMGLDLARYKNKRFAERGMDDVGTLSKGPFMLVGEAAGIDPVTGEGIAQAIEYGALAGTFLAAVLRGETQVSSWSEDVRRSRLGFDLRVRRRFVSWFYGSRRVDIERVLLGSPSAIVTGGRHFGALPLSRRAMADMVWRAGAGWLRSQAKGGFARIRA